MWTTCGAYDEPVPAEMGVHSLEHGAVWVTYRHDPAAANVEVLRNLVVDDPFVLVSPWSAGDVPAPIVASAWRLQLALDRVDDPRLADFVSSFANGPQTPEQGVTCLGGVGEPAVVSRVPAG